MRRLLPNRWFGRAVVTFVAVCLVAAAGLALHHAQVSARHGVKTRFAARATLAANFVGTYVSQLTAREEVVAGDTLTGPAPAAAFAADVSAFGFPAAVLLDHNGNALGVAPAAPSLVGHQLGSKYAHLTAALAGRVAVSNIVPAASTGQPVVAFAVPFQTSAGRRVFSGAYAISDTPLGAFLDDSTSLPGAHLFLTDGNGMVLASNGTASQTAQSLTQRDPGLSRAAQSNLQGNYRSGSTAYTFVKAAIPGTTWTVLIAAPTSKVFVAVEGSSHWLPWMILGLLSLLIGVAGWLAIHLLAGRRQLAEINAELETIARTDGLTGLSNRRHLTEQLEIQLANGRRHGFAIAVLMIDIDHFKVLNDTYGHSAGDVAIRHVAERLAASLRDGDLLARWGGEEFLAVLPYTEADEGVEVAKRLCNLVSATPIPIGSDGDLVTIRTSVGVAQADEDSLDELVNRADLGLYEAKTAGRNTVRQAPISIS